jgi:hypothetical protein
MSSYLFLAGAIICEVIGTLLLPYSKNFTRVCPSIILVVCYVVAFVFLSFAVREIPLNDCLCILVRSRDFFGLSPELLFIRSVDLLAGDYRIGFDCDRGDSGKWIFVPIHPEKNILSN